MLYLTNAQHCIASGLDRVLLEVERQFGFIHQGLERQGMQMSPQQRTPYPNVLS
jgi:hypothetical protein